MDQEVSKLEAVLCDCYEAETEYYRRALELIERMPSEFERSQSADAVLQQLSAILETIAAIDMKSQQAKTRWTVLQQHPGPRLKERLDVQKDLLERMLRKVEVVERMAQQSRSRLIPQLNAVARGQQMQNAYGAAANQGQSTGV